MAQCTAKSKRSGKQCKKDAVVGSNVCHIHGGKSPGGIASGTYKNGRYSKFLPDRLTSRFQTSIDDPNLLELRAEIALTDGRLEDLLKRVDTGESGRLWDLLQDQWTAFREAVQSGDKQAQGQRINEVDKLIRQGVGDYAAWREIHNLIDHRRRLVESERKRLVEAEQYITAQQAMLLVSAMLGIIKENVSDKDTLRKISRGVNALVTIDG